MGINNYTKHPDDCACYRCWHERMDKIKDEHAEIMEKIKRFQEILNNEDLRLNLLADDLKEVKEKYGDDRRSNIEYSSSEVSIEDSFSEDNLVEEIEDFLNSEGREF